VDASRKKIGLVPAARILSAAVLVAVGGLVLVVASGMDRIAERAVETRDTVLPGIMESQRTMLNVERLLRFSESVAQAADTAVRHDALNLAQALVQAMAFEKDRRISDTVRDVMQDVQRIAYLRDQEEALFAVRQGQQALLLREEAARLWTETSARIEELSRTVSRNAVQHTSESFTAIAGQARRAMYVAFAVLGGVLLLALAAMVILRRHVLAPALHAVRGLEEIGREEREVALPAARIREFDLVCRAVERLGAVLVQNAERRRDLEGEIAERQAVEAQLASLNRHLEDLVAERTRDLECQAAELQAANVRLRDLDELKSGFLSSVSHELRTPLTSIFGFVKLVAKDFTRHFAPLAREQEVLRKNSNKILDNLGIIIEEGERLTRLINNVLDLSRIESGRMPWDDRRVALRACLHQAAEGVAGRFAPFTRTRLAMDAPPGLPDLNADPDRIVQMLINLLDNAAKFTPEGEVRVSASGDGAGRVRITVADTGPGIPPTERESIFNRFHQAGNAESLTSKPGGAGLGLAICKEIVEHYQGRIWVESQVGRGSRFHVELPGIPQEAGEAQPAA
jgi:signal transduction histidine kinase